MIVLYRSVSYLRLINYSCDWWTARFIVSCVNQQIARRRSKSFILNENRSYFNRIFFGICNKSFSPQNSQFTYRYHHYLLILLFLIVVEEWSLIIPAVWRIVLVCFNLKMSTDIIHNHIQYNLWHHDYR